jgi:hypothetical protein
MDSIDDDHDRDTCPRCRFKAALAEHLADMARNRESAWHDATGRLTSALAMALSCMATIRACRLAGYPRQAEGLADEAAAALLTVSDEIEQLHDQLDDDDDQGDGWSDDD